MPKFKFWIAECDCRAKMLVLVEAESKTKAQSILMNGGPHDAVVYLTAGKTKIVSCVEYTAGVKK